VPVQRKYTLFAVLTASVCILAVYLYRHRQGHTGRIDNLIISLTGAVQQNFFYIGHGSRSIAEHYLFLVNTKKQNEELEKEVESLRAKLALSREIEQENARLREKLVFKENLKESLTAAHVVAHDVSPDYVGIRIDKGAKDGIKPGMGVISPGGLIGRVRIVTENYSDVVTLIDPTSNIDVVIQRSRARGILSGQSKQLLCRLKYVDRLEDIAVNDTVISSDFGGVFPKGLLVGYVTAVIPNPNGILQSVVVKSAVDVFRLEEVFVVFPTAESKKISE
jgi:rod shape-determining protein MreC